MVAAVAADGHADSPPDPVPLKLWAEDGSRWFEYTSNGYAELGLRHYAENDPTMTPTDPSPLELVPGTNDGYFFINPAAEDPGNPNIDPSVLTPVGGGANIFVYDNDFQGPYSIQIDSELTGTGVELRSVTGFNADFAVDIADDDSTPSLRYTTQVGAVSGTASFVDGVLTNLCFDAGLTLSYHIPFPFDATFSETGQISFRGNRFEMLVADAGYERDDPAERVDSNGNGSGDDDDLPDPVIPPPDDPSIRDYVWDVFGEVENVSLSAPGDYDGDGVVTVLDYELWREQFGSIGGHADGNYDCVVDAADYTIWRDNFIGAAPTGSIRAPEPATLWLPFAAVLLTVVSRRKALADRPSAEM